MVDDSDVVRVSKSNRNKYLNNEAYLHLTRDMYIRQEKAPKPVKPIKRKPARSIRPERQLNGARA